MAEKQPFLEHLKKLRILPNEKNSLEYREYCYNKWKNKVPMLKSRIAEHNDEEIVEILIAHQLRFRDELEARLTEGANKGINLNNLVSFLNTDIKGIWKGKDLLRNANGLDFLKYFVRDIIYQTGVKGKHSNPTKNLDSVRDFHRAVCICFILNPEIDFITVSKLAICMQIVGSVQVVSNFRPTTAAALYQRYAIDYNDPNKKEINILVPSEGFFGRLLASYYLAYHNRDKIINYHCIDPNEALSEPFEEVVKYLRKYGGIFNKITNWNPTLHKHGSEVPEADFKKTLGIEFDLSFTSPPYGAQELYLSALELYLGDNMELNEINEFHKNKKHEKGLIHRIVENEQTRQLKVGDKYSVEGKEYTITRIGEGSQSHRIGKSMEGWNELFFRPTVRNCFNSVREGGFVIWNVAAVKAHPNLENDCVRINQEEGLEHIDTLRYILTRRPGSKAEYDENGNVVSGKEPFEPVFVFQKPKA